MPPIPLPSSIMPIDGVMPPPEPLPERATITPWVDPVVDRRGHDPRSRYVELFWLGTLGPTATWLIRRLAAGFDRDPGGYELNLPVTARALGLSISKGTASPFAKALHRCVMFGLAQATADGLAVRRRIPTAPQRHLSRLPAELQAAHDEWQRSTIRLDGLERARRLATAMLDAGDDVAVLETQLVALGVAAPAAAAAFELVLAGGDATPPTAA